jgi:hypothetical protein
VAELDVVGCAAGCVAGCVPGWAPGCAAGGGGGGGSLKLHTELTPFIIELPPTPVTVIFVSILHVYVLLTIFFNLTPSGAYKNELSVDAFPDADRVNPLLVTDVGSNCLLYPL